MQIPFGRNQTCRALLSNLLASFLFLIAPILFPRDSRAGDLDVQLAGSYFSPGILRTLAAGGSYAYVYSQKFLSDEITILDCSDPTQPRRVGGFPVESEVFKIVARDSMVYVAAGDSGLILLDVSDPSNPREITRYDPPLRAIDVAVVGSRIFVVDGSTSERTGDGLVVLEGSDPKNLARLGSNNGGRGTALAVEGSLMFTGATFAGLTVFQLDGQNQPVWKENYYFDYEPRSLTAAGGYVYYCAGTKGLSIFDVRQSPIRRVYVNPEVFARQVVVQGNRAYVNIDSGPVLIWDVTDPARPVRLGSYAHPSGCASIAPMGDHHVLAAEPGDQLLSLDVSKRSVLPRLASSGPDRAEQVFIFGQTAYVGASSTGVVVMDIFVPAAPLRTGGLDGWIQPRSMLMRDGKLFISGEYGEFHIYDVTEPRPRLLSGGRPFCPDCHGGPMFFTGDHLVYLSPFGHHYDPAMTVSVVDVSMLHSPQVVSGWDEASDYTGGLALFGKYAYVSGRRKEDGPGNGPSLDTLTVLDISDPLNCRDLGYIFAPSSRSIAVNGQHLYLMEFPIPELVVFDLSNPERPREIARYDLGSWAGRCSFRMVMPISALEREG